MKLKAWQKTSLIEYPGRLSTVLFVGGCNFRCPFCYNSTLVLEPGAIPDLPGETVLGYLEEHRSLYQAAVVTGGEPTLCEDLPEFLEAIKSLGLLAGLETNGSRPAMLRRLLDQALVDFVAVDVKGPLESDRYSRAAGLAETEAEAETAAVRESLGLLAGCARVTVELRCTVVPSLHRPGDIRRLGLELVAAGVPRLTLQQFRPERALDPALRRATLYRPSQLEGLQRDLTKAGLECSLRGL